jgi:uncharacterized membrane protein HdeD (DUF308 family)
MASAKPRKKKKVVQAVKPWSSETAWWVLAIEAVIALGLGVYALIEPAGATSSITIILAAFLLVDGLASIFSVVRRKGGKMFHFAGTGVGILAGLLVLSMAFLNVGDLVAQGWILGMAFVLVGFFNLLALFFERDGPIRWVRVLVAFLMIALGGVYIYSALTKNTQAIVFIGWLLLAVGLMLGLYAAFVWSQTRKAGGATATAAPAATKPAATKSSAAAAKPAATKSSTAAAPPAAKPSQATKASVPSPAAPKETTPPVASAPDSVTPQPPSVDGGDGTHSVS